MRGYQKAFLECLKKPFVLLIFLLLLAILVVVRFTCPHDSSYDKKMARQKITSAFSELNFKKAQVVTIDYIPHNQLPEEECWEADAYRVISVLKGTSIKFVNTVNCNIIHDPYAKKSLDSSQYADQLKIAPHSLTEREVTLLKEYAKLCKLPIEDFGYCGDSYETGVGEWEVWPEFGAGYFFLYKDNAFRFLRKANE